MDQAEALWQVTSGLSASFAGSFYDYRHLEGTLSHHRVHQFSASAPPFVRRAIRVDINSLVNTFTGRRII